jgi:hypothetical protein
MAPVNRPTVHLVGSVPLADAEAVFRAVGYALGEHVHGIPDGETGERSGWIGWQLKVFMANPALELVSNAAPGETDQDVVQRTVLGRGPQGAQGPEAYAFMPHLRLRGEHGPLRFEKLGYADAALQSYQAFARLKADGAVPEDVRFQVSLPTPLAPLTWIDPADVPEVAPAYQQAFLRELHQILDGIPHDQLEIQWDVATEVALWEGAFPSGRPMEDVRRELLEHLLFIGNEVPADVPLGYHLCYGDLAHRHFKEPEDLSTLVEIANQIFAGVRRPIQWIHMPVPRDRSDDAYFEPLRELRLPPGCRLYLGLVHYTDGVEGGRRRLAAAAKYVQDFGVATECGFGRRPPETIPALLKLHAELAPASGAG